MSKIPQNDSIGLTDPSWASPSEPESHVEHREALDATLFRPDSDGYELVLELDAGELRLRRPR